MKNIFKLILLLTLFVQSSLVFGQINFTNGGGDKLFSNAANWSTGAVPTATDKIKLDTNGDTIIVDGVYSVRQVLATKVKGAIIGNGGNDTLYINGNSGIGQPIQANGTDARVAFHLPVVLETTVGTQTKAFATNGAGSHIKFFDVFINNSMHLTISNPNNKANTQVHFDGKFISTKWLNINANSKVTFGENSDFTEHKSAVRFTGNAGNGHLTVKSAKDKFKTSDTKVIVNTGGTLIADAENVLSATIQVDANKILNLTVNKNQSNAGLITIADSTTSASTINLSIDSAVTSLNFADNSASSWGNGKIVVTNFRDNVIGFGSNENGITSDQLSQIDIGTSETLYSYSDGTLSTTKEVKYDLMITGVMDPDGGPAGNGDTTNFEARAIELYAVADISDLSKYGIGAANNGGGTDGVEYTFPQAAVSKGTFILVGRDSTTFRTYYGVDYDYNGGGNALGYNGDDAIELFYDGVAIDVYGDIDVDGTNQSWDYADGWAYRKNDASPTTSFDASGWNISGKNVSDGFGKNELSDKPFPIKSYLPYKQDLMILGIVDPDGHTDPDTVANAPKTDFKARAVEFYVINDIPDLSKYGFGVANNGGGTDGVEYTFPADSATAGSFILVGRDSAMSKVYYGKDLDYVGNSNALGYNGDDAFELFYGGFAIDIYGDVDVDGTGQPWDYVDGWVHRKDGKTLSTTFNNNDWENSGTNATDDYYTNKLNTNPYPLESFSGEASPTSVLLEASVGSANEGDSTFQVSVGIIDPSSDSATVVHFVYTGTDSTDIGNFISETITFPAGSSESVIVNIPITDDTDAEGEESFTFALQNLSGGFKSSLGIPNTFTLTIKDNDIGEFSFVYNELHIDPANDISGDANGDGTRDPKEDEFIELVNTGSTAFDLSGYYMTDNTEPNLAPRHIFPTGTVVDSGQAIIIFGGGTPTSPTNFGGAVVQTASENNDGVGLGNDGKILYVKNSDGLTVLSQAYDATQGNANQSTTRSPDLTGDFISHSGVTAANGALFSPGMKLDSTIFYQHTSTKVQFQVMEVALKEDNTDTLAIGVTINGSSSTNATEVTIGLATGGTGTSDDINLLTQTLSFDAGSSETKYVSITTVNDDLQEGNESFIIEISSVSGGDTATIASPSKVALTIADDDIDNPLILNEVLTDPPQDDTTTPDIVEGDANGDGTRAAFDDEFVELVNTSSSQLDVSGYLIFDKAGLKHSVPENTVLESGQAFVVFGGGSPTGDFGGAVVQTASSGSLILNNGGDKVIVNDKNGNTIIEFEYGGSTPLDGESRQSLTRDPDITGGFVLHTTTTAGGVYSPGTKMDGSTFDVGTTGTTKVQFAVNEFTLANEDGSYNTGNYEIEVQISNPSSNVATQVEVLFTASDLGSAADISDYAGEVLTFSSGSTDSQVSAVTISSSSIELGTKYDFALQNATGGNVATIGENSTFTLIVGDPGSVPLSVENDRADITISPNPTTDFINVKINRNKVLESYFVTDMSGSRLDTRDVGRVVDNIKVDARNFDNGLYILGLNFEGESVKLKFIKR
ncbi:MAG: hypothetical protein CNE34_02825 [Rhodothermaeota bacterium MED-G18]|nr:MAG: hypothetical protein CNE34_02825 [Rhodothermaeota bacterium MED-G18]